MISVIKSKLSSWNGRLLSIRGRVTLLNLVLSNLLTYYLSFFKIPIKVRQELIAKQHNILWNEVREKRVIAWVSWATVCKPNELGGLGIKDISNFNKALISKWLWHWVTGEDAIWKGLL